jgi:hypothetical protein
MIKDRGGSDRWRNELEAQICRFMAGKFHSGSPTG